MAHSSLSFRVALAGLGSLALLAGCGGGGTSGGVARPGLDLIVGGPPTVQKLSTPLGLTGSRGAGALVYVAFNLRDKEYNATDIQLEFGYDVSGPLGVPDGQITGSAGDPTLDDEFFPCTPAAGLGDGIVGLNSSTGKGSDHLFVWNSAAVGNVPAQRYVTQDYQYSPQGRLLLGSDGLPSFGNTPGIRLRMRGNDQGGKPGRWGPWKTTAAFDLNNNTQPVVTIDPSGMNGVTPNVTGTAADEDVVLNIHSIDEDSGLGFPDPMAVAVDYAAVPVLVDVVPAVDTDADGIPDVYGDGTPETPFNAGNPIHLSKLSWFPATTFAGTADTGLSTASLPGVAHTFTWDSAKDVGTTNANYILRATPFDSKSELGPTVAQPGGFKLDNLTIFTDAGSSLAAARVGHRATTLADDRVLITGGSLTVGGAAINQAELFYPGVGQTTFGAVAPTAPMGTARAHHSQVRLHDDRVLVSGGLSAAGAPLTSVEIYDSVAGTWSSGVSLVTARARHRAVVLSNGDVLFVGGVDASGTALASAEIFHLDTNTVTTVPGGMLEARRSADGALLPDGRVIIPGGTGAGGTALSSTEIYDPVADSFSAGPPMASARTEHSVSSATDGSVYVAGGIGLATVEIFDPRTNLWSTAAGALSSPRSGHAGILMGNGSILAAGGFNGTAVVGSADEFATGAATFNAPNGSLNTARRDAAVALLNNGRVLIVGGQNAAGGALSSIEVYSPDGGFNYGPTAYITTPNEDQSWGFGAVFNYRLVDPEQDRAKVIFQYSIAGAPWKTCTSQGGLYLDASNDPDTSAGDINEGTVDLVTAPANISKAIDPVLKNTLGDHLFVWQLTADIAKNDYPAVKVRCLPFGAGRGVMATTTSFRVVLNSRVLPSFEGFAGNSHGSIDIWYHLMDIDNLADPIYGDSARVEFEYGIDLNNDKQILADDGEVYKICTEVSNPAGSEGLGGSNWGFTTAKVFALRGTDPTGWHLFRWDSVKDLGSPDIGVVRTDVVVRLTPYDNPLFFPPTSDPLAQESKGRPGLLTSAPANGLKIDLDTAKGLFLTRVENEGNTQSYQTFPTTTGAIPFSNIKLDEAIVFTFNQPVQPVTVDGAAGLDTLKVMVGTRQVLGAYRSDTATNKVFFYPKIQEITDNLPKYTRAVTETQTILFRGDTVSVVIPGYVAGSNPETAVVLRTNGFVSGAETVGIANLLTRNYASAFTTTGAGGTGAFQARGAAGSPTYVSGTPTHASAGNATSVTTVTLNFTNQISGEAVNAATLRFRVDLNGNNVVDANDPVVFGKYQVVNTAGTLGGTASSVITFVIDSAFTFPPGSTILVDFSTVTAGDGTAATGGTAGKYNFSTVAGASTTITFTESFSDTTNRDSNATNNALWASTAFPGIITGMRDGGNGTDGVPTTTAGTTTFSNATYNFSSFTQARNQIWRFTYAGGPVTINSTSTMDIAGVVDVSGGDGIGTWTEYIGNGNYYTTTTYGRRYTTQPVSGATANPGGTSGAGGGVGAASQFYLAGLAGGIGTGGSATSPGGGGALLTSYKNGGGGGGHAKAGQAGGLCAAGQGTPGAGGTTYGTDDFSSGMTAGSGGGAGASYTSYGYFYDPVTWGSSTSAYYYNIQVGGSGGGGGGAVKMSCNSTFTLRGSGIIDASGGNGGNGYYTYAGGGGGGAGGGVWIRCGGNLNQGGIIDVRGGTGGHVQNQHSYLQGSPARYGPFGGHGSAGRVRLEAPNIGTTTTNFIAGTTFNSMSGTLNGGDGSLSTFPGSSTATFNVDTDSRFARDAGGYMNFSTMNIPASATVTLTGTSAVKIRCTGGVSISGTLRAVGETGSTGQYGASPAPVTAGGKAGPGGSNGGSPNGSNVTTFTDAGAGSGSGGGKGGYKSNFWASGSTQFYYGPSSGGGGANMINFSGAPVGSGTGGIPDGAAFDDFNGAGNIQDYFASSYGSTRLIGVAGTGFNDPEALAMTSLVGGSGGGAGANGGVGNSGSISNTYGAGAGGGGGGAIGIETSSSFTMAATGVIDVRGGTGGPAYTNVGGAGAGGAGGTVLVRASSYTLSNGASILTYGGIGARAYIYSTSVNYGSAGVGGIGVARIEYVTKPSILNTGGILGYSTTTGSLTTANFSGGLDTGTMLWQTASGLVPDFNNHTAVKQGNSSVFLEGAMVDPVTGLRSTTLIGSQNITTIPLTLGLAAPNPADGFKYWRLVYKFVPPSVAVPAPPEIDNVTLDITTK